MRTTGRAVALLAAWTAFVAAAHAAAPPAARPPLNRPEAVFQRTYFFDEQTRERLEADIPARQAALVEYGGAYIPSYTFFNDIDNDHAHLTTQDLRLWTQIQIDGVHRIYARGLMRYIDWAPGDARGFRQYDLEGMNLEVGWYELDAAAAARKIGWGEWPLNLTLRLGRQYVEVGRGIVLGEYLDGGMIELETRDVRANLFAARSIESMDNRDRSVPGFTRSRRNVYGVEVTCQSVANHQPYGFWVYQRDWSEETPPDPLQLYRYDSHYVGVGLTGGLDAWTQYVVEAVWERGRSPAHLQTTDRERIQAFAFDAAVTRYVDHPMDPEIALEYAYASGDDDRGTATTALFGNTAGTPDEAFLGFGYVNSGLALGARFTNLQFVRLGGRLTVYENKVKCGRLDLGGNYYWLWKADSRGPISDAMAVKTSADIGQEIDVFCEWQLFSDVALSLHYGRFHPGQAYLDRQPRDFVYGAITFSF